MKCRADYFYVSSSKTCSTKCPPGYTKNVATRTCVKPCTSGCIRLKCSKGYFKQDETCVKCNSSCLECCGNANNCTACPTGSYLFESSCLSNCPADKYAITANNTCGNCVQPMALTPSNVCMFCGCNCKVCSDEGYCLACDSGLQLKNGACMLTGLRNSARFNSGLIKTVGALSLLEQSTFQAVISELHTDLKFAEDFQITWLLFAKGILPDFLSVSCQDIQNRLNSNNQKLPSSAFQIGSDGYQFSDYTKSNAVVLNFSGLRGGLKYNYTICIQNFLSNDWEAGSIEFQTKDNGYRIERVSVTLEKPLAEDEWSLFLCAFLRWASAKMIRSEAPKVIFAI